MFICPCWSQMIICHSISSFFLACLHLYSARLLRHIIDLWQFIHPHGFRENRIHNHIYVCVVRVCENMMSCTPCDMLKCFIKHAWQFWLVAAGPFQIQVFGQLSVRRIWFPGISRISPGVVVWGLCSRIFGDVTVLHLLERCQDRARTEKFLRGRAWRLCRLRWSGYNQRRRWTGQQLRTIAGRRSYDFLICCSLFGFDRCQGLKSQWSRRVLLPAFLFELAPYIQAAGSSKVFISNTSASFFLNCTIGGLSHDMSVLCLPLFLLLSPSLSLSLSSSHSLQASRKSLSHWWQMSPSSDYFDGPAWSLQQCSIQGILWLYSCTLISWYGHAPPAGPGSGKSTRPRPASLEIPAGPWPHKWQQKSRESPRVNAFRWLEFSRHEEWVTSKTQKQNHQSLRSNYQ